jgi:hypothetical protein
MTAPAKEKIEQLGNLVIGEFSRPECPMFPIAQFPNFPITQFCQGSFMLKNDRWIRKTALEHDMINPFSEKQVREGVISFGLSSYGYDLRVADEFKIFTNVNCTVVDPKNFDERSFVTVRSDVCIVRQIPSPWRARWSISRFRETS